MYKMSPHKKDLFSLHSSKSSLLPRPPIPKNQNPPKSRTSSDDPSRQWEKAPKKLQILGNKPKQRENADFRVDGAPAGLVGNRQCTATLV